MPRPSSRLRPGLLAAAVAVAVAAVIIVAGAAAVVRSGRRAQPDALVGRIEHADAQPDPGTDPDTDAERRSGGRGARAGDVDGRCGPWRVDRGARRARRRGHDHPAEPPGLRSPARVPRGRAAGRLGAGAARAASERQHRLGGGDAVDLSADPYAIVVTRSDQHPRALPGREGRRPLPRRDRHRWHSDPDGALRADRAPRADQRRLRPVRVRHDRVLRRAELVRRWSGPDRAARHR